MTIEEKARAYDEAIERAKEVKDNPFAGDYHTDVISYLFPKLNEESEDERHINTIISAIHGAGNITPIDGELAEKGLKSIRPQITWKPTEEQMKALNDLNLTGGISYVGQGQTLIELYKDLKKL